MVWGSIAAWIRGWFRALAIGWIFLMGFSRVYLGVHFPTDVLAGWIIGLGLVLLFLKTGPRMEHWLVGAGMKTQMLMALGVPLLLLIIHPTRYTVAALAPLAGAGVGLSITQRYVSFSPHGPWWQRICRFLAGAGILVLIYGGLRILSPEEPPVPYLVFRFIRYFLVGLWITLGGPWFFRVVRLAPLSPFPQPGRTA